MPESVSAGGPEGGRAPRVLLVTIPLRSDPDDFPPFGSMAVISALRRAGFDAGLYDIDSRRPAFADALATIVRAAPDVLGISAVVSTGYDYVKRLSLGVKELLPGTTIILGGNMGASGDVLLRKTGVDFVALGEGERVAVDFLTEYRNGLRPEALARIPGLLFAGADGQLVNTGYAEPLPKEEIFALDWRILEEAADMAHFFPQPTLERLAGAGFRFDPRIHQPHRQGKAMATLVSSKGCVSRCTFCHRWDKGIRNLPVAAVVERLREVMVRYNVGFVTFADENFGADQKWLLEFCAAIKPLDLLWRVGGMRVNRITPELLTTMKAAGCSAVYFGMETGSARILEVMEKKVKVEDNYNAIRWIVEAGLHTSIQLVIGMPGENWETIRETGDFLSYGACLSADRNPLELSITHAQALPGTPLYEFARAKGMIGADVDGEETYLLAISNRNAADASTSLNFSGYPRLVKDSWRPYLILRATQAFVRKFGQAAYDRHLARSQYFSEGRDMEAAAKPRVPGILALLRACRFQLVVLRYPVLSYRCRVLLPLLMFVFSIREQGLRQALGLLGEYVSYLLRRLLPVGKVRFEAFGLPYISLRKIVFGRKDAMDAVDAAVVPLRKGR